LKFGVFRTFKTPFATGLRCHSIRKSDYHFARTFVLITWLSIWFTRQIVP